MGFDTLPVGRVLSSGGVADPKDAVGALDRFRETSIIPRGGPGSALLPGQRRCRVFDLRRVEPQFGLVALVLVTAAVRAIANSRVRSSGFPLRACPGARTWRRAARAGAPPRKRRLGVAPLPEDCLSLTTGTVALGWPHVCPRYPRCYCLPPRDFPHFSHVCRTATAGVRPPLKP